jgi:hypothetical protein
MDSSENSVSQKPTTASTAANNSLEQQQILKNDSQKHTAAQLLISLKVQFVDTNITKTLQFHPTTLVFDALKIIRDKIPETNYTDRKKKN